MAETDDMLEPFFNAGRRAGGGPSDAFLARIEADALAALDARTAPATPRAERGWRGVLAALGGWRVGAGLATAAMAGVVLGVSLPASLAVLDGLAPGTGAYELGDFGPGYGLALLEDG